MKKINLWPLVAALIFCLSGLSFGQATTGSIDGTVKDPNGALVPNVSVTVSSTGTTTGFKKTATTDEEGRFQILKVPPGVYSVSTVASGFKTNNIPNVEVTLARSTALGIVLEIGVGDVTIDVNASDTVQVDLSSTSLNTNITSKVIESLPRGTTFASLLKTVPNVRPAKTPVSLYFDKKTNLLFKFEFSIDFPSMGESIAEYSFSDYRPHPHLIWFPANRSIKLNGNIWRTMNYKQVLVDSSQAETMLRLPPELEGFITPPGTVKEIAKGVYLVYRLGGYQPMFVEFKDFVVAFEAPAAHPFLEDTPIESLANPNALSEEFIAKIKQTIKDKPIKYVVPTHYHSDHAGGIRAFATENSTVLTTPGNKAFFEKFAPNMKVETFENKRTLSDGERIVDLINVGANPHTKENIVVYLPREKYLYQGDLFYFGGDTTFPIRDRLMVMPFFAAWLRKMASLPREFTAFIAFHSGRCNTFTGF